MSLKRWCWLLPFVLAMSCSRALAQIRYDLASKQTIEKRLELYKGNDTKREAALKDIFTEAGCSRDQLTEQTVPKRRQPNVVCVLPGSTSEMIVVGAHFDHVDAGDGVVDNWSGASMLPSLYQALRSIPRRHTFIFVGFTGEEDGLLGSNFYAKQLSEEQVKQIEVMVNLDTLGLGPSEVWAKQSDPVMVNILANVARTVKVPLRGMDVDGFGESDEESFISRKVCAVMVHSLTSETTHVLHHSDDNMHAVRLSDLYDTYRLLAAYLAVLDTQELPQPHVCTAEPVQRVGGGGRGFRGSRRAGAITIKSSNPQLHPAPPPSPPPPPSDRPPAPSPPQSSRLPP